MDKSWVPTVNRPKRPDFRPLVSAFVEELDRLDPRDFDPSVRTDFVVDRAQMRNWATSIPVSERFPVDDAERFERLLPHYLGEGTRAQTRDFSFVSNPDLRKIVERDYRELSLRAFPDGAWKSTIILAGSILEAVLLDRLTKDQAAIDTAMKSAKAPKKKGGIEKDLNKNSNEDEWTLNNLIEVACDLKIIPFQSEGAIHHALRGYCNLVHPRLELEMRVEISEGHATASKGMLDVVLDHLP